MGSEIACTATLNGRSSEGKALLETSDLVFRGDFRLKIPFGEVSSVKGEDGILKVRFQGGEAVFELGGARAQKWARKILNPPSLAHKLGLKAGQTVSVLGIRDEGFLQLVKEQAKRVSQNRPLKASDIIFLGASERVTLDKLHKLKDYLKPEGAIWIIRPKGRKEITEADVIDGGKAAGLVDVKVARFSETHTAEKLVIPLSRR